MKLRNIIAAVSFALIAFVAGAAESDNPDADTPETPVPEARPRLDLPWDAHPFRTMPYRYFDPWYAWDYPYAGYYYPHRFGYRSDLYYNAMYGFIPEPGHTELSVSVGSDDYFGTSLSHTGYVSQKNNIGYNITTLWETGETYWSHRDYESFTVAPTFFWSNENTLVYLGFEYTNTHFDNNGMSPFRPGIAENDLPEGNWVRTKSTDYIEKRASVGLEHQVNDVLKIGVHFEARDIDRKRSTTLGE